MPPLLPITLEEFIAAWQTSSTTHEVASRTNLTVRQAVNKAAQLRRRHKIPLKSFASNHTDLTTADWANLRKLARDLLPKEAE